MVYSQLDVGWVLHVPKNLGISLPCARAQVRHFIQKIWIFLIETTKNTLIFPLRSFDFFRQQKDEGLKDSLQSMNQLGGWLLDQLSSLTPGEYNSLWRNLLQVSLWGNKCVWQELQQKQQRNWLKEEIICVCVLLMLVDSNHQGDERGNYWSALAFCLETKTVLRDVNMW